MVAVKFKVRRRGFVVRCSKDSAKIVVRCSKDSAKIVVRL